MAAAARNRPEVPLSADTGTEVPAHGGTSANSEPSGSLTTPNELREYCITAIRARQQGSSEQYAEMVHQISCCTEPLALCGWLEALTQCVSDITDDLDELIAGILGLVWHKDSIVATAFVEFLCHLVSANGCFVEPCIRVLVQHMLPCEGDEAAALVSISDCVHSALEKLLKIFPASFVCLAAVLRENFPHKRMDTQTHIFYLRNLLRILNNAPELYAPLLSCIVEKCIELDVDIKPDDHLFRDNDDEEEHPEPFQMDAIADDTNEAASTVAVGEGRDKQGEPPADESMAHKLDSMLDLLFDFIRHQCRANVETGQSHQADHLFRAMMRIFNSVIVTTHQSKFVQFLMFYTCSLDSAFADSFMQATIDATTTEATPMNLRLLCSAYLSSFVGRARFVSAGRVKDTLASLVQWSHSYIDTHNQDESTSVQRHDIFYSIVQSIFYVICFRHKALLAAGDGRSWLRSLDLRRIVASRLNPLEVCSQDIVGIFVRIMDAAKVLDCTTIMEQNSAVCRQPGHLDLFFPFDPYLLPLSVHHIEAAGYLQYADCIGEEYEDDGPCDSASSIGDTPTDSSFGSSQVGSAPMLFSPAQSSFLEME